MTIGPKADSDRTLLRQMSSYPHVLDKNWWIYNDRLGSDQRLKALCDDILDEICGKSGLKDT